jgi:hypothetical protein
MLPPGFELAGRPVVTVIASYISDIEWLAGRGYNTLGVGFPATFSGEVDEVTGFFLLILWENLADPIITGREELGFAKLYCELPEPTPPRDLWHLRGGEVRTHCTASWLGFTFLDLEIKNCRSMSWQQVESLGSAMGDGILHYKYIPRTGEWGKADVEYPVLTPAENPNQKCRDAYVGEGTVKFHRARWEDMPTQFNIVNAFHELEIVEYCGATLTRTVGGKDLRDQRILR